MWLKVRHPCLIQENGFMLLTVWFSSSLMLKLQKLGKTSMCPAVVIFCSSYAENMKHLLQWPSGKSENLLSHLRHVLERETSLRWEAVIYLALRVQSCVTFTGCAGGQAHINQSASKSVSQSVSQSDDRSIGQSANQPVSAVSTASQISWISVFSIYITVFQG